MESEIKQDTSSAESTLAFVRASSLLIPCHIFFLLLLMVPQDLTCCKKSKRAIVVHVFNLTAILILSTAGVAVYSTIYINKIGFTYGDLGAGWYTTVVWCSLCLIFCMCKCMVLVEAMVHDGVETWIKDRNERRKQKRQTQQPQNKINADDWQFVKFDDRDTIVEIDGSALFKLNFIYQADMDNAVTDLLKTINLKMNTLVYFQKLLDNIWDKELVGKGADAKHLSHKTLNVISVDPGYKDYNINVRKYMGYRSVILKRIKRFGRLPCMNAAHCSPIQTTDFIKNVPNEYLRLMGMDNLNTRLNEYFLFHGTSECNAENIINYGFDISKVKRTFLGKGMYFTESPIKADQYTEYGSSNTGCILMCRVILGNFIIRKRYPKSDLTSWTHLPCSQCLYEDCSQHSPNERFDSLIYDPPHGLFREFVIFNTDQILVESVIKYTRVTDSENRDL